MAAGRDFERLFRKVADGLPVVLAYLDTDARFVWANRHYLERFADGRADSIGRLARDVVGEAGYAHIAPYVERVLAGEVVKVEHQITRTDGSTFWAKTTYVPDRDEHGRVVGFAAVSEDVDEARRMRVAQEFLTAASRLLASSLDYGETLRRTASLAVPRYADWCFVDLVDESGAHFERVAASAHDRGAWEVAARRKFPVGDAATHGVAYSLQTGRSQLVGETTDDMLRAIARDEDHLELMRSLHVRSFAVAPMIVRGKPIGALSIATATRTLDTHDLWVVEELARSAAAAIDSARLFTEQQRLLRAAEEASRIKDQFLAMLGHELRNPLAPITTALQLIERDGGSHRAERAIVGRQVAHMSKLVDDLLDVSRIAAGRMDLDRELVALSRVLADALDMARPFIERRRHTLQSAIESDLFVDGDARRLAQVFGNLLTNAAKYTPDGGHLAIEARAVEGRVVVSVTDDGVGIDPELRPRLFEPFTQAKRDATSSGLGLGLAIVRSLVAMHGGVIDVASEGVGRGTRVTVTLPIAAAPRESESPDGVLATLGNGMRVLVVDDNVDAAELLTMALSASGYDVRSANDGKSAVAVAAEFAPAVAVLDLGLPDVDGLELAARLRALEPSLKLVALTGYGQEGDRRRTRAAGFHEHLVKPVDLDRLESALASVMT